jgi:putative sigma-54 modulation protein
VDIPIDFLIRAGRHDTVDALREYAGHRLSFTLRRFVHRIRRVNLRLVDLNGPRRGVDSRCSIVAELTDGGQLFVDAIAAWPFAAITRAASRLSEAMRREGDRHAEHRGASAPASRHHDEARRRTS